MKQFRQHGMSAQYEYVGLGFNYRMSDLHASIAVEQLKKANKFNAARQKTAAYFDKHLAGITGIELPTVADDRTHVYHQYTIRITDAFKLSRSDFVDAMRTKEIGVGVYYPKPLPSFEHIAKLGYSIGDFPEAEKAAAEVVSLPVHPRVSEEDAAYIVETIQELAGV
jgi:dTDP-4-amino-4,6-dideoxygalactose transaminase